MTDRDDLAWLEALMSAMTPRPWRAHNFRSYELESWSLVAAGDEPPVADDALYEPDARAIAALRNLAPELLAMIDVAIEARRWVGCSCAPLGRVLVRARGLLPRVPLRRRATRTPRSAARRDRR